jgi:catechol 2,3-dioxygenase
VILRLGHVELLVDDLDAAAAFYVDLLGFAVYARSEERLLLRAAEEFDAWSLCLTAAAAPGLGHLGFRVAGPDDLDDLERLHAELGLASERVAAGVEPAQGEALRALTPDGHPVEFYHRFDEVPIADGDEVRLPMRDSVGRAGVPPGRLDHVNLRVPSTPAALEYWIGSLGFSASELWLHPDESVRTAWLRRAHGTHDVALGEGPAALHHFAYTVSDPTALIRAADLVGDAGESPRREYGPSRHGATNAFCLYLRDPAGHRLELYTNDYVRDLDRPPIRWSAA